MGDAIKEQSLIIDTPKGLIIVTGCSHQGIVNILKRAKDVLDRPIHLVFGGFHLGNKSEAEVQEIIANFKELKVEKCGHALHGRQGHRQVQRGIRRELYVHGNRKSHRGIEFLAIFGFYPHDGY